MLNTGLITEVEIIDLNHMGQGVAKIDNFVVFVSGAITGDTVEIEITETKKNYAIGQIINVVKPSEFRTEPPCKYYEQCGGCQLMHMDYNEQLRYKKNRVINELNRADIHFEESIVQDTMGMEVPYRYRNKTAFSVTERNNKIQIGPYEQGTYNTVDINSCMIQSKEADNAVEAFKNLVIKYDIKPYNKKTKRGIVRNIAIRNNRKDEFMLIIVTTTENFPSKNNLVRDITSLVPNIRTVVLNINDKDTNLILGRKNITLYGEGTITDTIDDLNFTISPETFFQINPAQTEKLYQPKKPRKCTELK
ncbi:23S rRNA (uracil(1939)-C(5))-methyltransferase RlmD [Sedimentibacter sp.]|uniref:23S rRNA (uracil(1939)-C(5))-methyltransferase RlmD n=1 Tax=Sedimentibacter sp. TaxID=1960295 RepID=UPI00289A7E62|nr:23S rRNA (uracil(1939)-C(5))-methyltransferase RlmD [Sedimentibacter sp.]